MKYFVFADPHGDYEALLSALNENGYDATNPEHQLVGLGDYFGRAAQSTSDCVSMWNYLTSSEHLNKPICLRGNHESILIDAIERDKLTITDIRNGEHNTFASFIDKYPTAVAYDSIYQHEAAKKMSECGFLSWLESLPWYYETDNNIFTHGFVPVTYFSNNTPLDSFDDYDWDKMSWCNTPELLSSLDTIEIKEGKTVIFGHWTSSDLVNKFVEPCDNYGNIFMYKRFVGIDYTTVLTHKVGCIVVED